MKIPEIGETITPRTALAITREHRWEALASKIWMNLDKLQPFVFDGMSGVPSCLENIDWIREATRIPALRHDLEYYVGDMGDEEGRLRADKNLYWDIRKRSELAGFDSRKAQLLAEAVFSAVRAFGGEEFEETFSWGFGWKDAG